MVVIEDFEMPESCLMCTKRKCLHIDGKAYQMCGLNEDGCLTESWFNSENVSKDHRSEYCPLREVEAIPKADYEARLKADLEVILKEMSTEIEEEQADCLKLSNCYERFAINAMAQRSQIVIQQKIDALKGEKK